MKSSILSVIFILSLSVLVSGQSANFQKERRFFDFLIGEWTIQSAESMGEKWTGGRDAFKFSKALDGNAIASEWFFNRGTPSKPNYANAIYYMGFDNSSQSWTFYYVSPQSAQFYKGRYEDGNWYFYKTFTVEGKSMQERQNWLSPGKNLLKRTIESSEDDGKTWKVIYQVMLKKKA